MTTPLSPRDIRRAELHQRLEKVGTIFSFVVLGFTILGVATPDTSLAAGRLLAQGLPDGFGEVVATCLFLCVGGALAYLVATSLTRQGENGLAILVAVTVITGLTLLASSQWTPAGRRYSAAVAASAPSASACALDPGAAGCPEAEAQNFLSQLNGPPLAVVVKAILLVFLASLGGLFAIYGAWTVLGIACGVYLGVWYRDWLDADALSDAPPAAA